VSLQMLSDVINLYLVIILLYMVISLIMYLVSPVQNATKKEYNPQSFFFLGPPLSAKLSAAHIVVNLPK
jgi:hypothetical protein